MKLFKTDNWQRKILLFAIFVCSLCLIQHGTSGGVFAATDVTSISASPNSFNPTNGETTTITVDATAGTIGMELRVLSSDGATVIRSGLTLTEGSPGVYTAIWNGRNNGGSIVSAGDYVLRVYNPATNTYMGPLGAVTVVTSVVASPDPFVPTGSNSTTITVQATPGQTGLKVAFSPGRWYGSNGSRYLPLTETATPGIYTAQWDAVCRSTSYNNGYYYCSDATNTTMIAPNVVADGTYTIYVYDAAGNQYYSAAWTVQVTGVSSVTPSVSRFAPSSGETVTFTANGVTGLNLGVQLKTAAYPYTLVRSLPMGGSGPYTAAWDGRDSGGNLVAVGNYTAYAYSLDSGSRYYPTASVTVAVGVSSVSASPDPFVPTGSNSTTITVQATPGQTGLKVAFSGSSVGYWRDSNGNYLLPLTETATSGTYTAQWDAVCRYPYGWYGYCRGIPGPFIMPDGTYTIYVYDSANTQYSTTGTVRVTGAASPNPFTPGGNNVTTITASGGAGLNLEARVYNNT